MKFDNIKELFDICKYIIENKQDVKIIGKNGKKYLRRFFQWIVLKTDY